ncbi:MAG TPA: hypothetical protein VFJ82_09005 [Longimicrobium sp.]|nr:hypothetical protein [Longimicrobium sp.]
MSDLARRCVSCGVDLAAAAAPYPATQPATTVSYPPPEAVWTMYQPRQPYTAGERPISLAMRVSQVVAVLLCVSISFAGADWETILAKGGGVAEARAGGEALGYVFGAAMAPFLASALFLAWSRKTRQYIPFMAMAFVFLSLVGGQSTRREEVDRELSRTRGMMTALRDSADGAVEDDPSTGPPESQDAKLVWAMNRALAEVPAHLKEVAGSHDVDPDDLPAAWGTSRYTANAALHPEVERYWTGYQAYLADFRGSYLAWLKSRVTSHAREAGVRPGMLRAYVAGMNRGGAGFAESEPMVWADSTVSAALALHRFLVSVDARVSYDAARDMAMFDREADLERANALNGRVASAAARLNRARQEARRRGMQQVDSLAVHLR